MRIILALLFASLTLSSRAADPIISEFMPANARVLADEDGQFPDWLEIHNPDASPVNLLGWHLTDQPLVPVGWTFPSVTVPAGGYLVVFASGKNRVNNPARLHTSFSLNADGGHLALVKPDGSNIVSAYTYPSVKEDVSFGVAQSLVTSSLLANSTPRILVPTSAGGLPPDWNHPGFVPGAEWLTGAVPPAVGFDTNQTAGVPVNVARSGTAAQSTVNGSFTPNLALDGNLGNFTHTLGTDTTPFWQVTLTNEMAIFSVVLFNRTSCCGSRLRDITIEIISTNTGVRVTNYTSTLLNPENAGFAYPNGPPYLSNNLVSITGGPVTGRFVLVRRAPDPDLSGSGSQGNTDEAAVLSLGEVVVNASAAAGLRPYLTTDLESAMRNVNPSAFIRMPFDYSATFTPTNLTLNTRYDDGFVAYLNGVEVARRNAPASPTWNSTATADRNFASAAALESINVSSGLSALTAGANVLAVHLLNAASESADALFQAELTASGPLIATNVYFDDATPGAANTTPWYYDEVRDTRFSVDRGFYAAPFSLSITSGTPDAVIYCSFNADEPGPGKGFLYTNAITISNTTVLRARAFKTNWKATDVDTATYLFLADVIHQVPNWPQDRIPPRYFPASWGANAVDYGMDPNVVSRYTSNEWREALTQIPSMSIVTEMPNLFDPTTGIYANAMGHGEDWERPMSLELLDPTNAVPGRFQENGGLRIRGGFSRNPQFFKHSFRIFFNRGYGAGSLDYPLFGDDGAQSFDKFDLRTSQNYSWPRTESPTFDTMVREVFCRKTLGDMGQPYRRSRYYHLYLNGQYWGLYETDERPSAYYGEAYFGGNKTNYDVVKCGNRSVTPNFATEATDGNFTAWSNLWSLCQLMRTNPSNSNYFRPLGCNPDGTRNPALPVLIDVDNLIDYMLEIFFSGDGDATLSAFLGNVQPNNWFGMRDRANPNVGFRFFNSDCEHTLGSPSSQVDRTGPFGGAGVANEGIFMWSNPQWMHEELMRNPEYRVRFADHVQKHFFNGGALTLEACTNRLIAKATQINKAIRAYSARWGDATSAANTANFFGATDWTNAIAFCLNWLPPRAAIVLNQLRADGLYATLGAPNAGNLGGQVAAGYNLVLNHTNGSGVIYFTTDGSDPRLLGGVVSSNAQSYSGPIIINAPTQVRARVLTGTNWSAIVDYIYYPPQDLTGLAVTEIMYHPPDAGLVDGDEFEFLELKNTGPYTLNLGGLRFNGGITFTFSNSTFLPAGQFFVLVRNPTQFAARYPGVAYHGVYLGKLDNAGENLSLLYPNGSSLLSLSYNDRAPWPVAPDSFSFSLVPVSPNANADPDNAATWRASTNPGGSPGSDDPAPGLPPIRINEALTATLLPERDTIELFNPTDADVDIGGWFLTDNPEVPKKYRIPDGTIITNGSYLTFDETQFNPLPGASNSFSLRAEGDDVYLFSGDSNTNLTGYSHGFAFGAAAQGITFGRYELSTGEEDFTAQLARSFGGTNAGPRVGPIVINEVHYHPNATDLEFVELRNISDAPVDFFDNAHATNTWRLNGLGYTFPQNFTLPPDGLVLIVGTNPATFRARHGVLPAVPILGPYAGQLQDSGERLELQRPGPPDTNSPIAYIDVDAVRYNDKAPWPPAADGSGPSLQRTSASAYGNDPIHWEAAIPTPGRVFTGGIPPTITMHPTDVAVIATREAMFSVAATGPDPLYFQWLFEGSPIPNATNTTLVLTNLQFSQAGRYSALVFNEAGSVASAEALLTVLTPASIISQPQNVLVKVRPDPAAAPMTNATFTVQAMSSSTIQHQWRFNGSPIMDATNFSLTISNVQVADGGDYDCAITDAAGTIFTSVAKLFPLVNPVLIVSPVSQSVVVGGVATFSVEVTGNPKPFSYEWRRSSAGIVTNTTESTVNFFSVTAPSTVVTQQYRVVVKNLANNAPGVASGLANLAVLADQDLDGIPDLWETAFGFNANESADRDADDDHDGMGNWAEYIAGTDPTNGMSYLKVDGLTADGTASLTFNAVSNRTYTVQFADTLSGFWSKLAEVVARTNSRPEAVSDPGYTTNRFYRLVTPRQPDP